MLAGTPHCRMLTTLQIALSSKPLNKEWRWRTLIATTGELC